MAQHSVRTQSHTPAQCKDTISRPSTVWIQSHAPAQCKNTIPRPSPVWWGHNPTPSLSSAWKFPQCRWLRQVHATPLLQGVPAGEIVMMKLLTQCEHSSMWKGQEAQLELISVPYGWRWLAWSGRQNIWCHCNRHWATGGRGWHKSQFSCTIALCTFWPHMSCYRVLRFDALSWSLVLSFSACA